MKKKQKEEKGKKLKKSGPKNEEGEKVGKEVNKYMDGSKYFQSLTLSMPFMVKLKYITLM